MISCDVNVLIYAHNADDPRHVEYLDWLEAAVNGDRPFGLPSLVCSGFLRIVTHPKVLTRPLATEDALDILERLRIAPAVVPMEPGQGAATVVTVSVTGLYRNTRSVAAFGMLIAEPPTQ